MGIEDVRKHVHEVRKLGKLFITAAKRGFLDKECTPQEWVDKIERAQNQGGAGKSMYVAFVFSVASDICSRLGVLDKDFFKARHPIDVSLLPFDFEKRFSLSSRIGEGYFRRAYLVTPKVGSGSVSAHVRPFVVTWNYRTVAEGGESLRAYSDAVERNREYLKKIYADEPSLLISESTRIVPIRRDGGDVLISVGEYIDGDITNFLEDTTLFELLADTKNSQFRKSVATFVHATLRTYAEEGVLLDLRGEHNVIIQRKDGAVRLKILDVNMLYSEKEKPKRTGDISLGGGEKPLVLGVITESVRGVMQEQIAKLKVIDGWLKTHQAN